MEWKNANKILPERGHRVLCLYPNGKMDVQLYLGRESFVHDLYGRCIFWTELPKRPKAYFNSWGAMNKEQQAIARLAERGRSAALVAAGRRAAGGS